MTTDENPRSTPRREKAAGSFLVLAALLAVLAAGMPWGGTQSPAAAESAAGAEHPGMEGMEGISCTECHQELLENPVVHPPAAEGECETCHEFTRSGERTTVSLTLPPGELCRMCHEDESGDTVLSRHPPAEEGDCTLCHDPHSSRRASLLLGEGHQICLDCHADLSEELERPRVHGAIDLFGCPVCHEPHASTARHLLRRGGNALCLGCHAGDSGGRELDEAGKTALWGKQAVAASLFDRFPKLPPLAALSGHPVAKHPVEGDRDPLRPGEPFGCVSCHPPHGAMRDRLLVGDSGTSFCRPCHSK